ncbi:MAG: hypothetical protein ARM1_0645 [Candidatus Micrarchaeota archaeon]|nr:MAG: hypothetical protein ARM1_0645 [Candidatus Micrarchaeota archaeon]
MSNIERDKQLQSSYNLIKKIKVNSDKILEFIRNIEPTEDKSIESKLKDLLNKLKDPNALAAMIKKEDSNTPHILSYYLGDAEIEALQESYLKAKQNNERKSLSSIEKRINKKAEEISKKVQELANNKREEEIVEKAARILNRWIIVNQKDVLASVLLASLTGRLNKVAFYLFVSKGGRGASKHNSPGIAEWLFLSRLKAMEIPIVIYDETTLTYFVSKESAKYYREKFLEQAKRLDMNLEIKDGMEIVDINKAEENEKLLNKLVYENYELLIDIVKDRIDVGAYNVRDDEKIYNGKTKIEVLKELSYLIRALARSNPDLDINKIIEVTIKHKARMDARGGYPTDYFKMSLTSKKDQNKLIYRSPYGGVTPVHGVALLMDTPNLDPERALYILPESNIEKMSKDKHIGRYLYAIEDEEGDTIGYLISIREPKEITVEDIKRIIMKASKTYPKEPGNSNIENIMIAIRKDLEDERRFMDAIKDTLNR